MRAIRGGKNLFERIQYPFKGNFDSNNFNFLGAFIDKNIRKVSNIVFSFHCNFSRPYFTFSMGYRFHILIVILPGVYILGFVYGSDKTLCQNATFIEDTRGNKTQSLAIAFGASN